LAVLRSCGSQGRIIIALGGVVHCILAICPVFIHGEHVNQLRGLVCLFLQLDLLLLDLFHQAMIA
jgi:hypothetical protein